MNTPEDNDPNAPFPFLPTPEERRGPIALARRYAALSVSFDPEHALSVAGATELRLRMVVVGDLLSACEALPANGRWSMRFTERSRILQDLYERNALEDAVAWRETQPDFDEASRDLADALCARRTFARDALDAILGNFPTAPDGVALQRMARALGLAAPATPVRDRLPAVQAAAAAVMNTAARNSLLDYGVVGRDDELERLMEYCRRAWAGDETRALYFGGIGGVGKSTLLAEAVNQLYAAERPIAVHLDFDRTGLDENDGVGLAIEVVRQVELALGVEGASLRGARQRAAGSVSGRLKKERATPPTDLLQQLAGSVRRSGRKVLLVIDTLEILAARGDENPRTLFRSIDAYRAAGLGPMAVLAAGRGGPPPLIAGHMIAEDLNGLPDEAARKLLSELKAPRAARDMLVRLAKGNPLVLRLGARLANDAGAEFLRSSGLAKARISEQTMAGQLYRLILSRLPDQDLRAIAHPGLLIRRLNADLIREVIAPEIGMDGMTPERATALFAALSRHAWLVDLRNGWVSHRPDLREVLLPLQFAVDRPLARRLNRRAAEWFALRPEPWAESEALYHRLQRVRDGGRIPNIDPAIAAQFDETMLADLSVRVRNAVHFARGERSELGRAGVTARSVEDVSRISGEAEMLLDRGAISEAVGFVDRAVDVDRVDPLSSDADVLLEVCWRGGDWIRAHRLLRRRDRASAHWPLPDNPARAAAQMQLRAELMPHRIRSRIRRDPGWAQTLATVLSETHRIEIGGPLAWLFLAEGYGAPQSDEAAAWHLWSQPDAESARLARVLGRKVERAGAEAASNERALVLAYPLIQRVEDEGKAPSVLSGEERVLLLRLLAVGSPYAAAASERIKQRLQEGLDKRLDAVSAMFSEGLLDGEAARIGLVSGPFAAERFDARGRLAEWLGALSWLEPNLGLDPLAQAAERRRRTLAGAWAYGEPPGTWRGLDMDALLHHRLERLLDGERPEAAALETLTRWGELLPGRTAPLDRLHRRLETALAKVPRSLFGTHAQRARTMATALAGTRIPAVLLPELAVHLTRTTPFIGPPMAPGG